MELLTEHTLRRAIEFAAEHERTSISIIVPTFLNMVALHHGITDEYRNLRGVNGYSILFSNKSIIRLFSLDSARGVRGFRSNIVLVHADIKNQDAEIMFGRMGNKSHGHPNWEVYYSTLESRYVENTRFWPDTCKYMEEESPVDLGDLQPSSEILEYIGELCG